jgi:hypothetical protein
LIRAGLLQVNGKCDKQCLRAVGNRNRRLYDASVMTRSCFASHPRIGIAALQLAVSRRTIMRNRAIVAAFILHCQLLLLGVLMLMAATEAPLFIVTREAFDETTHKVAFKYSECLSETAQISCWHVLIFRMSITIGWKGFAPMRFSLVLPPVVVLSTSASALFSALDNHPQYSRVFNAVNVLRQASQHSIRQSGATNECCIVHASPILRRKRLVDDGGGVGARQASKAC